jgi:hypothetical protein
LKPEETVLKLNLGDRIRLSTAQFERLSKAFLGEIQSQVPPARRWRRETTVTAHWRSVEEV